jgi:hypothetical protein
MPPACMCLTVPYMPTPQFQPQVASKQFYKKYGNGTATAPSNCQTLQGHLAQGAGEAAVACYAQPNTGCKCRCFLQLFKVPGAAAEPTQHQPALCAAFRAGAHPTCRTAKAISNIILQTCSAYRRSMAPGRHNVQVHWSAAVVAMFTPTRGHYAICMDKTACLVVMLAAPKTLQLPNPPDEPLVGS